jgi:hypothetical protein
MEIKYGLNTCRSTLSTRLAKPQMLPQVDTIVETSEIVPLYPFNNQAGTFMFTNQHNSFILSVGIDERGQRNDLT